MEDELTRIVSSAAKELESILTTKTVVGEPIQVDGHTLIPLISVAFGLGVANAGGEGKNSKQGRGQGGGVGFGGGVKPIAVLISSENGVRLESIRGSTASAVERVAETIGNTIRKRIDHEPMGDGDAPE